MRYIEYDKGTGKILSFLNAEDGFRSQETGLIPVPEGYMCDPDFHIVRNGEITRSCETDAERAERRRTEEERKSAGLAALKHLGDRLVLAFLFEDDAEVKRIRAEAKCLKIYY